MLTDFTAVVMRTCVENHRRISNSTKNCAPSLLQHLCIQAYNVVRRCNFQQKSANSLGVTIASCLSW